MESQRYPIGRFRLDAEVNPEKVESWVQMIAETPGRLRAAVHGLSEQQLDRPYREGGWTVRQVVHHVADSHLNAYVRTRLALTEPNPTIKTYDEARWAELSDAKDASIEVSLSLLEALHLRWVMLLRSLDSDALDRPFHHPEMGALTVGDLVQLYAWHGKHHVAHIVGLREREMGL